MTRRRGTPLIYKTASAIIVPTLTSLGVAASPDSVTGTYTFNGFTSVTGDLLVAAVMRISADTGEPPSFEWNGTPLAKRTQASVTGASGAPAAALYTIKGGTTGNRSLVATAASALARLGVLVYDIGSWDGTIGIIATPEVENTNDTTLSLDWTGIDANALAVAAAVFNTDAAAPVEAADPWVDLDALAISTSLAARSVKLQTTAALGATTTAFTAAASIPRKASVGLVLKNA